MAERRWEGEPDWPAHFIEYRESDGWESKLDWEIARVQWARAHGFKGFKVLPLIQSMAVRPRQEGDE